jgi:hypothetical protein
MAQAYRDSRYSPKTFQFMEKIGVFIDESEKFDKYLRNMDTNQTAAAQGLRLRTAHRIHPKVCHDAFIFLCSMSTAQSAVWLVSVVTPTKDPRYFQVRVL